MKVLVGTLLAAGIGLSMLAAPVVSFADTEGVSLHIGDLSTPEGARSFDDQIDKAATRICLDSYSQHDIQAMASCKKSVREEALQNLSAAQRQAYAEGSKASASLASTHGGGSTGGGAGARTGGYNTRTAP